MRIPIPLQLTAFLNPLSIHLLQLPFQHAILALLLAPNATLLAFQPRQIADSAPNAEIPTATDAAIPAFLTASLET